MAMLKGFLFKKVLLGRMLPLPSALLHEPRVQKQGVRAGEMGQWLRSLVALSRGPGLDSQNPHGGSHHLQLQALEVQCPLLTPVGTKHDMVCRLHSDETLIRIK